MMEKDLSALPEIPAKNKWPELKPHRPPDILNEHGQTRSIEVGPTGREQTGRGLFATKLIAAGEEIFVFDGGKFESDDNLWLSVLEPNAICVGQGEGPLRFIYAKPSEQSPARYINHSCDPNTARKTNPFAFAAIKDIGQGEQITTDYSLLEPSTSWHMPCSCDSKNCRRAIDGVYSLPLHALQNYWTGLPEFMKLAAITWSEDHQIAPARDRLGARELENLDPKKFPKEAGRLADFRDYLATLNEVERARIDTNLATTRSSFIEEARRRLGAARLVPCFENFFPLAETPKPSLG